MLKLMLNQGSPSTTFVAFVCHVCCSKPKMPHLRRLSIPCLGGAGVACGLFGAPAAYAGVQSRLVHGHSAGWSKRLTGPGWVECTRGAVAVDGFARSISRSVSTPILFADGNTMWRNNQLGLLLCSERFADQQYRKFSSSGIKSGITEKELKREIDDLTDRFMETRELLEDAMEAKGTVYFNDDLKDAKEAVVETLSQYEDLMEKLSEEQERNVRRTIGLKMEELRAQEAMIDESLKD